MIEITISGWGFVWALLALTAGLFLGEFLLGIVKAMLEKKKQAKMDVQVIMKRR